MTLSSITEALKKPFTKGNPDNEVQDPSNTTDDLHIVKTLSDNDFEGSMVFSNLDTYEWEYGGEESSLLRYQSKIIEMYDSGDWKVPELSEMFRVTKRRIYQIVNEANVNLLKYGETDDSKE